MNTAERRQQILGLLQAVLPAFVEALIVREAPKPVREHQVVTFSLVSGSAQLLPPDGDGWELADLNLGNQSAHWTRIVYPVEPVSDTVPPDAEYEEPFIGPEAPMVCALCGAFEGQPHDPQCAQEMRDHAALSGPLYVKRTPK